jgi:hypothetical protein
MNPRWSAHAESQDGIHWEKPDLGIIEFDGSRDSNLVWMGPGANMAPFRDDNPDAPDEQRYKAVVRDIDGYSMTSSDDIFGDEIERVVTWNGSDDLSELAGQTIRLKSNMKQADLYSLQFRHSR